MKKLYILCTVYIMLLLVGCSTKQSSSNNDIDKARADMTEYKLLTDTEHVFYSISAAEATELVSSGTGILYTGYPTCPSCIRAVPVLNTVAKELNKQIMYIDVHDLLADEASEQFLGLIAKEVAGSDSVEDAQFYVPMVIAIKDGKITNSYMGLPPGAKLPSDSNADLDTSSKEAATTFYTNLLKSND